MSTKQKRESDDGLFDPNPETPTTNLGTLVSDGIEKQNDDHARAAILTEIGIQEKLLAPTHQLTPAMASYLIKNHGWKNQRKKDKKKIDQYKKEMVNGRWKGTTSVSFAVLPDEYIEREGTNVWMFDAQHRCYALEEAGEEDPNVTIDVVFIYRSCKNHGEIATLFENIDNPLAARKQVDYNKARDLITKVGVQRDSQVNVMYAAIMKAATGFRPVDKWDKFYGFAQKEKVLVGELEFIDYYFGKVETMALDAGNKSIISYVARNSDFIAPLFFVWKEDQPMGERFINRITTNNSIDIAHYPRGEDPINILAQFMRDAKEVGMHGMNVRDWSYVISEAWNAFARQQGVEGELPLGGRPSKNLPKINCSTVKIKGTNKRETQTPDGSHYCFIGTHARKSITDYRALVGDDGISGRWQLVDLTPPEEE